MEIITHPHNKSAMISMGGLRYVFYLLSPQFDGPPFVNDKQVAGVINLIIQLTAQNVTLLREFLTIGVGSIKQYILNYVPQRLRSRAVLNSIEDLLSLIENCDPSPNKDEFVKAFCELIMDSQYWRTAPKDVLPLLASYIHKLVKEKQEIIKHGVVLVDVLDMVKQFFPHSFAVALSESQTDDLLRQVFYLSFNF